MIFPSYLGEFYSHEFDFNAGNIADLIFIFMNSNSSLSGLQIPPGSWPESGGFFISPIWDKTFCKQFYLCRKLSCPHESMRNISIRRKKQKKKKKKRKLRDYWSSQVANHTKFKKSILPPLRHNLWNICHWICTFYR